MTLKDKIKTLGNAYGVSGDEFAVAKIAAELLEPYVDRVEIDEFGNVSGYKSCGKPGAKTLMLDAHIDEIGLIVTHICSSGLLKVAKAGGIHPSVYPGHQVMIHHGDTQIPGVVIFNDAMEKGDIKDKDLYIDIGAKDAEDAKQYVQAGDPIHLHTYHQELLNGYLSARAVDDRGCAFIILEALKRAKEMGCKVGVYAATTVGEETTMRGAYWAAARVEPDVAIAVDVTYAQDYPGTDPNESGPVKLGKGPVICNSSIANKKVNDLLKVCAAAKGIPYQMESYMGRTGTDADKIHFTGTGVTTALVSLPLRYMHSPSEVCQIKDVENAVNLLAHFLCSIDSTTILDPFAE